jgi:hypothetical protein
MAAALTAIAPQEAKEPAVAKVARAAAVDQAGTEALAAVAVKGAAAEMVGTRNSEQDRMAATVVAP